MTFNLLNRLVAGKILYKTMETMVVNLKETKFQRFRVFFPSTKPEHVPRNKHQAHLGTSSTTTSSGSWEFIPDSYWSSGINHPKQPAESTNDVRISLAKPHCGLQTAKKQTAAIKRWKLVPCRYFTLPMQSSIASIDYPCSNFKMQKSNL